MLLEVYLVLGVIGLGLTIASFLFDGLELTFLSGIMWLILGLSSSSVEISQVPYEILDMVTIQSPIGVYWFLLTLGVIQIIRGIIIAVQPIEEVEYEHDPNYIRA